MQLKSPRNKRLSQDEAEAIAVAALSFLAAEPERLGAFLAETGVSPESLRTAARHPGFLPAVLDYLIGHETELVTFAAEQGSDPSVIVAARQVLPGATRDI